MNRKPMFALACMAPWLNFGLSTRRSRVQFQVTGRYLVYRFRLGPHQMGAEGNQSTSLSPSFPSSLSLSPFLALFISMYSSNYSVLWYSPVFCFRSSRSAIETPKMPNTFAKCESKTWLITGLFPCPVWGCFVAVVHSLSFSRKRRQHCSSLSALLSGTTINKGECVIQTSTWVERGTFKSSTPSTVPVTYKSARYKHSVRWAACACGWEVNHIRRTGRKTRNSESSLPGKNIKTTLWRVFLNFHIHLNQEVIERSVFKITLQIVGMLAASTRIKDESARWAPHPRCRCDLSGEVVCVLVKSMRMRKPLKNLSDVPSWITQSGFLRRIRIWVGWWKFKFNIWNLNC